MHVGVLADQLAKIDSDLVTYSNYTLTQSDINVINQLGLSNINKYATNPIPANAKAGDVISIAEYSSNDMQFLLINSIKEQQNEIISQNQTINELQTELCPLNFNLSGC